MTGGGDFLFYAGRVGCFTLKGRSPLSCCPLVRTKSGGLVAELTKTNRKTALKTPPFGHPFLVKGELWTKAGKIKVGF
jgi:hypothetical protein